MKNKKFFYSSFTNGLLEKSLFISPIDLKYNFKKYRINSFYNSLFILILTTATTTTTTKTKQQHKLLLVDFLTSEWSWKKQKFVFSLSIGSDQRSRDQELSLTLDFSLSLSLLDISRCLFVVAVKLAHWKVYNKLRTRLLACQASLKIKSLRVKVKQTEKFLYP